MQTLMLILLPCIIFCTWGVAATAQTVSEIWRQKNTRLQYLEQQVAALEAFKSTVEKGYKIAEEKIHDVENNKEEGYNRPAGSEDIDHHNNIFP